jgi:hypothetical protein
VSGARGAVAPVLGDAVVLRPSVRGKFLWVGDEKLIVRGITYGTFRPGPDGSDYAEQEVVEQDFEAMAASGFNCVRLYTSPPRRILDAAFAHDLRVLVGLPWEQHVTFLDDARRSRSIEERVRHAVRSCAGHPSLLGYAIGNEIPAPIVRWHGRRRVERFLRRLWEAVKEEDPEGLVTYVNYPSTEYLETPFADLVCFNVFLESPERLEAYLARLQHVAGDRPLILTEIGLDSRRNGEDAQAAALDWQIRTVLGAGCAGAFVFSWTDEWHRGGHEIDDWDFGLTDRERRPKPALEAVANAFATAPFSTRHDWPRVSVVICTYNGARTLHDCLAGTSRLDYPDYEVIVVDDGSTDGSADIAAEYDATVFRTENCGLASARNTGLAAATGEIVAYLDDDARPDPHWLRYLVLTLERGGHGAVGGPNVPPPDGPIAECVAHAPGGPIHVLQRLRPRDLGGSSLRDRWTPPARTSAANPLRQVGNGTLPAHLPAAADEPAHAAADAGVAARAGGAPEHRVDRPRVDARLCCGSRRCGAHGACPARGRRQRGAGATRREESPASRTGRPARAAHLAAPHSARRQAHRSARKRADALAHARP